MDDYGAVTSHWLFSNERLKNSPSRQYGLAAQTVFSFWQQATFFYSGHGHEAHRTINRAILYMQRFYMRHSLTKCHKNDLCPAALFLVANVGKEPLALEDVIKVSQACLGPDSSYMDTRSQAYKDKAKELLL